MTYYVCKQCNYKHTFLPLACAKCKGTNFYPLITSELTENTSVFNGMEIQQDVLKLRIENERLQESFANSEMNLQHITDLLEQSKEIIKTICEGYASTKVSEIEMIKRIQKAEAFLKE